MTRPKLSKQASRNSLALRTQGGTTIAEFGPTLFLAFIVFVFPMMALGQMGFHYLMLMNITEQAAEQAAKSQSFNTDNPSTTTTGTVSTTTYNYSAVHTATNVSQLGCNSIGNGAVKWNSTNTYIYVSPLGGGTATTPGPNQVLGAPAQPNANTYNCVVKTNADLAPMFPGAIGILGKLPAFNTAMNVTCVSSRVFESPADLTD